MARRMARQLAPVLIALVLAGACSATDSVSGGAIVDDEADKGFAPAAEPDGEPGDAVDSADPAPDDAADDEVAGTPLPAAVRQVGRAPERVIKEGTVLLEVDEGAFMTAYERVVEAARRLGGAVAASMSTTDDRGRTTGSVTVRVPVENYEDLLVAVGRIAPPTAQDIRSEEVTGQVVDLQSRLRHLRAQEAFYLGLLEDAVDVQDAITVQRQVDDIQERIEQLQGRLDHLEDRADYSTLTVEIAEAGAEPALAVAPDDEPSLAVYWQHARNGFIRLVGWTLVVGVTIAPLLAPLLLAYVVWRLGRRRQPAPATVGADVN